MADTQPTLIKISNGKQIDVLPLMVIGRHTECDIQLSEGQASRRHAKLTMAEDGVWLEDMGSANGTFVNGAQIALRTRLKSGDRLRFDVEEFDFRMPAAPAAAPSAADEGKTVFRPPESAAVVAESSGVYKRPGAWADPDNAGDASNKTKFIDPAQIKQMMNASPSGAVSISAVDGPHLQVVSGSRAGLSIKLMVGESGMKEWTIGSQSDREVQFQDSGVSSLHAKIVNEGARWKVIDQMSANGTFVNGKRSNMSYLTAGDRLRFGPVECVFHARAGIFAGNQRPYSNSGKTETGNKTVLVGVIAFVVTIVVLFAVYKFVM
jgi:pSer/pThr/pTyr-binding forkhead associated (FHA) protein